MIGIENILDVLIVEKAIKKLDWPLFKTVMDIEMKVIKKIGTFENGLIL